MRKLFVLILVVSIVAITANASHSSNYDTVHFTPVSIYQDWMALWGSFTINDIDAEIYDEVGVFVDNECFGAFRVDTDGYYGFLHVYGDDPTTTEKDGADPGDLLTIKIWDSSEGVEHTLLTSEYTGPDPLIWINGVGEQVDIAAETPAVPTLSEWGLIIFMTVMMGIGVMILRRRNIA